MDSQVRFILNPNSIRILSVWSGATLTVRPVRLEPPQYFRFTNRGRSLKSPKYAIKNQLKKGTPLESHQYFRACDATDLTVKLFSDICDMSETICVMKGILSPTYLKTIVKCFAFMNSTTKKNKVVRRIRRFFSSEWKQNYWVCFSMWLLDLSFSHLHESWFCKHCDCALKR